MNKLKVGSDNYYKGKGVHRASGEALGTVSSASALIFLTSDAEEEALDDSEITLSVVTGESPPAYAGTFPSTVSMTAGTQYTVRATITLSDGTKRIKDEVITASRD